jgi:hypothetical protein
MSRKPGTNNGKKKKIEPGAEEPAEAPVLFPQIGSSLIENASKIGIGTWDFDNRGTALKHVQELGFAWYYNWSLSPLWDASYGSVASASSFTPMVWGPATFASAPPAGADSLLAFNEPDNRQQANLTVDQALSLWPELMATGLRLGSPATTMEGTLGAGSWLHDFMLGVDAKGYRVDFVAVHYYSTSQDVEAFKHFLEDVHHAYGLPIWVTEWALVDWNNPQRFSLDETATFAWNAIQMLDDLSFVERHAWFAAYEGGDGWYINTHLFDAQGDLTPVGTVFANLLGTSNSVSTDWFA